LKTKFDYYCGYTVLFIVYLLVFSLLDGFSLFSTTRFLISKTDSSHFILKTLFYVLTNISVILSIVLLTTYHIRSIRVITLIYLSLCLSIQFSLIFARNESFSLHEAFLLIGNTSFFLDAIQEYFSSIFIGILCALFCVFILIYIIKKNATCTKSRYIFLVPVIAFGLCLLIIKSSDGRISTFPIVTQLPVNIYYAYDYQPPYSGSRETPYISPKYTKISKHIILIVDESVRGDLLFVDHLNQPTTPFLQSISESIINYGITSSTANYSNASNIIIQTGIQQNQLPDINFLSLKYPNIFSYMKLAGYKTYLINNQLRLPIPTNFMTYQDISNLDGYIIPMLNQSISNSYEVDNNSINDISTIVDSDMPSFTYIVKRGMHFPYQKSYPHDTHTIFKPAMENYSDLRTDKVKTINSYMNGIRWNVDGFFNRLYSKIKDKDILILYTSDHGQSLLEDNKIKGHGMRVNPPNYQAMVPLLLIPMNVILEQKLKKLFINKNFNKMDSFKIFPTLLYLAGYDKMDVDVIYGKNIFDNLISGEDRRTFLSGSFYGRGKSYMNQFDATKIVKEK